MRTAAALCVKNLLAAQAGVDFWEKHKASQDPLLAYLNPFRKAKKKVAERGFCLTRRPQVCDYEGEASHR